jgi:hypothetical protein
LQARLSHHRGIDLDYLGFDCVGTHILFAAEEIVGLSLKEEMERGRRGKESGDRQAVSFHARDVSTGTHMQRFVAARAKREGAGTAGMRWMRVSTLHRYLVIVEKTSQSEESQSSATR